MSGGATAGPDHKPYASCIANQLSSEWPRATDRRSAIPGVTRLVEGATPSFSASS